MAVVDVVVSGRRVSFVMPARNGGSDEWRFQGSVSAGALKGRITHSSGGVEDVNLVRRCGYWDR